ncbi:MAG TPA: hypothetical protein VKP30_09980 [Polyangiaceae bacterium]|nr:hypothetical protein [Polyangiaceae bacterium]
MPSKAPSSAVHTASAPAVPDAAGLGREQLRAMVLRLGLPVLALWIVGGSIAGISSTQWVQVAGVALPAAITVLALGVVIWGLRQAKKARAVAGLVGQATSAEDRKHAIQELEQNYKKNDPAAVFAKAQLQLQEDPQSALKTLEQIDLAKVMPNVADEARAQRAMIHLLLGQVSLARPLADGIDLKRHEEVRSRAMMVAVMSEAWARSGQAKRAAETLKLFDPDEPALEQVRPQLWRASAYATAYANDPRAMKRALRKLVEIDPRMLAGFLGKKTHPLLQKEAKRMLEQSGAIPRKIVYQRQ